MLYISSVICLIGLVQVGIRYVFNQLKCKLWNSLKVGYVLGGAYTGIGLWTNMEIKIVYLMAWTTYPNGNKGMTYKKGYTTLLFKCGKPPDSMVSMRIVGGRRAHPHSFPWAVAILKNNFMHCGGAIITNKHVLSAGHCFKWDKFEAMIILIGLDNLDKLGNVTKRNISNVVIHEKFTSTAVRDENDIAIATLDYPVEFSDTVAPVCLPRPGQEFSGWVGTIVGWGRVGAEKSSSRVLLMASLRILSDEQCMHSQLSEHLKPTMMCAFSKGKDGCQGDSGGPLVVFGTDGKYMQAGIVSWGIGCADPRYPGVYTKVSNYIDWILKNTADGLKCS